MIEENKFEETFNVIKMEELENYEAVAVESFR